MISPNSIKSVGFFAVTLLITLISVWFAAQVPKYYSEQHTDSPKPINEFSPLRAKAKLQQLYRGIKAHRTGTLANDKFKQTLINELQSLGYQTLEQNQYQCSQRMTCAYINNIIAYSERPTDNNAILINTHYDSVVSGPGVGDSGVNIATALEIARYKKQTPGINPVVFLFSDGEELGLIGAEAFIKHPLVEQIAVVVNLEARGTHGRSLMFETSKGNSTLIDIFADSFTQGKTNSIFQEIYNNLPNSTDFTVFKRAGLTGYNFAFIGGLHNYHTVNDSLDTIDFNTMAEQGIVASNLIDKLTSIPSLTREMLNSGESVYTDIAGVGVISWPASLSLLLTALTIAAVLYLIFGRFGRITQEHSVKGCLTSCAFLVASIIITAVVGFGLAKLISAIQLQYIAWTYYVQEALAVVWATALLVGGLSYQSFTKKHTFYERLTGILLWFAMLQIIFAFVANGVNYLYLMPTLPAVLLLLWSKTKELSKEELNQQSPDLDQDQQQLWQNIALALLVFIYTVLATDLAYLMGFAIGLYSTGIIVGVFLVPIAASFVTLAQNSYIEQKILKGCYGVLALIIISGLWQINQPIETSDKQAANLLYFQYSQPEQDKEQAYWLINRPMRRLAPQLQQQFEFTKHEKGMALYPKFSYAPVLKAQPYDYDEITTIEQQTTKDGKQIRLTFKPQSQGNYYVEVKLPESLKYQSLQLNSEDMTPDKPPKVNKDGYRSIRVYSHYQKTLELTIIYEPNTADKPLIIDEQPSLVDGVEHPQGQALWALYSQYYHPVHRGSRSIIRRQVDL